MAQTYRQTWDLDPIFEGGSESTTLQFQLQHLEREIPVLKAKIAGIDTETAVMPVHEWHQVLEELQGLGNLLHEASSYVSCLNAQNIKDERAQLLRGKLTQLNAAYSSVTTALDNKITKLSEFYFNSLTNDPRIQPISFALQEIRRRALDKLPPEQEELVSNLSVDGYHAWGQLYNTIVARMQIPFEENGKSTYLSVGQAANKISHPVRKVRKEVFQKLEHAWQNEADLCATTLNHLAGYRLQLYKHRKWDQVLKDPLEYNRMDEVTLQAMWEAIEKEKHRLVNFTERKAKLLGLEKLSWYDLHAPLPGDNKKVSYDEAAHFIIEQFHKFSPEMANFARHAFLERWIEAEDRPNKRPGGFCTSFPVTKQSRIFMTFAGTSSNLYTLAHELGHAYHQYVMNDLPPFAQDYAMNVAETASTFAEMIVVDAAIKQATNKEERMKLLEEKLKNTISFFMDIHSRFLFETRFYEARKQGPVSVSDLNRLMTDAQKESFSDCLDVYHPHFWASKLHFYITVVPFYNFPYTFGYLFSTGIYARALEEGPAFAERYQALLRDTASMKVEELAKRHLGVDLRKPDFWKRAVDLALADVDEFLSLTE